MSLSIRCLVMASIVCANLISSVVTYQDDVYEDLRLNSLRDSYENGFQDDLYTDDMRLMAKRSFPRWHHAFTFRNPPIYRTSAIAETKRFLPPFHPLARFRGLSMHGSGGGIHSAYKPREDFETLVSSLPMQPSPAHPVPSDPKIRVTQNESEGVTSDEQSGIEEEKMNAGDILRYLSSMSNDRGANGRARVFRFGIK